MEQTEEHPATGLTLRVVVAHSVLLVCTPFVQSQTTITGTWNDTMGLLLLFTIGPPLGMMLYRYGQQRLGSIMLLAFMPAAAYTHIRIIVALFDGPMGSPAVTPVVLLFEAILTLLVLSSVLGSLLSFALLRGVHAASVAGEQKDPV